MTRHVERSFFERPALDVAPELLGMILRYDSPDGPVAARLTEVEAYMGPIDPGSHAFRGKTKRNEVMFGEPGRVYTYFTYGMHTCANIVCSPEGEASGVLLRAGEIVEGHELARRRRHTSKKVHDLASGPARLAVALGITLADGGSDVLAEPFRLIPSGTQAEILCGPRTGVSGLGGGAAFPWRFWVADDPTVSPYRKHARALD